MKFTTTLAAVALVGTFAGASAAAEPLPTYSAPVVVSGTVVRTTSPVVVSSPVPVVSAPVYSPAPVFAAAPLMVGSPCANGKCPTAAPAVSFPSYPAYSFAPMASSCPNGKCPTAAPLSTGTIIYRR